MDEQESFKIVLLGESGVGKTSIISQFMNHSFNPSVQSSINCQFVTKALEFPEFNKTLKFNIWDTVGQERYRSLAKMFYKNANAIVLVYDITSPSSFNAIKKFWYSETKNNADNDPIYVLVANKIDLLENERISNKEGENYAKEIKAIFVKTSAFLGSDINIIFEKIGKRIIKAENEIKKRKQDLNSINLKKRVIKHKKGCC